MRVLPGVTVGGKMKFACVDGPDFTQRSTVDELLKRTATYKEFEKRERRSARLFFKKEVK